MLPAVPAGTPRLPPPASHHSCCRNRRRILSLPPRDALDETNHRFPTEERTLASSRRTFSATPVLPRPPSNCRRSVRDDPTRNTSFPPMAFAPPWARKLRLQFLRMAPALASAPPPSHALLSRSPPRAA